MTRIIFMGTPDFAVPSLQALLNEPAYQVVGVYTRPDKPAGRGQEVIFSPVKQIALAHGVPVLQPKSLRKPEPVAEMAALQPDLLIVAAYGLILPPAVLDLPQRGAINVHASLLPRWRGAAPITAAILAGDTQTGITIMRMDPGMDTGPILFQAEMTLQPDDTTGSLSGRLATLGAETLLKTLPRWLAGELIPQVQDDTLATTCKPIQKEEGEIDWSRPAAQIARAVRAYQPWPTATTSWLGRQLTVLAAHAVPAQSERAKPGQVIGWREPGRKGQGAAIVTGHGLLVLDTVQLAGKRPTPIGDFLNGARGFVGSRLGKEEESR